METYSNFSELLGSLLVLGLFFFGACLSNYFSSKAAIKKTLEEERRRKQQESIDQYQRALHEEHLRRVAINKAINNK